MALPPMNPQKTAAGIVVDPKTLERVVPTSARKDGSLRKELKIRPGFTPQEDVGRFRGSRQKASETTKIPGSDRIQQPPKPDNPFAATPSSSTSSGTKTKAQIKNEKRRANKKVNKNWDESDDEDDDGVIGDEFAAADEARNVPQSTSQEDKEEKKGGEGKAWPVEDGGAGMIGEEGPGMGAEGGGIPNDPVPIEPKPEMKTQENGPVGTTAILSPPPPGYPPKDPVATSVPHEPEWRTASSKKPQKPHPIQGGRKGPIGLAHPPPIEPTNKPRPNRNQRKPQASPASTQAGQEKPKETPQPRVRKEVKVRDTGLGSLADRVKGLVIGNMDDGKKKEKKSTEAQKPST